MFSCFVAAVKLLRNNHWPFQFLAGKKETSGPPMGILVMADLTKFGRMGTKDLNYVVGVMSHVLSKQPTRAVGLVLCPYLVSEKVSGGQRGEIRSLAKKVFSTFFAWFFDENV